MLNEKSGSGAITSDHERTQSSVRLIMTSSIFLLMLFINSFQHTIHRPGLILMAVYYVFAVGQYFWIRLQPDAHHHPRKIFAIFADQSFVAGIAILGGESASYFHFVALWVSIGNGIRYGSKYMYLSNLVGTLGFTSVIIFSPYWREMWTVGVGVIIGLNLIPPYVAKLIRTLEDTQKELAHIVSHDSLTGLLNRRELEMRVTAAMARTSRHQQCMALIYLDLDGFKDVNDEAGHAAGDRLLQSIAKKVGERLRKGDTFIRLGGDEFIVLAEGLKTPSDASILAETIITEVEATRISSDAHRKNTSADDQKVHNSQEYGVSASVGIAIFSGMEGECISAEDLLCQADSAMYLSKKGGENKNKITFFPSVSPSGPVRQCAINA